MASESLKHKTKVGMYWTFLNQASTQIMQFVVGIVMARLLSPSDYGITSLPAVFMAVAGIFMDSGFGQALVRKPEVTEKDLATSFYYSLGMGIFMYACLFFAAPFIASFYKVPVLTPLIRVTALNFLWGPLGTPQDIILNRRLDFKTPARISIINKIIGGVTGITAAYCGLGLWALIISGLVSSLLELAQTWWAVKWLPKEKFSKESFKYLWNYGNKLMCANILDVLYNNVAPVVIGKFYSPATLGVFNRANGYAKLPANQITGIVQGVSFPVLSRIQDDKDKITSIYRRMIKVSCFVAFPIFFLLAALARPLIIVIITEKWIDCIIMLQIICFAKMWWPVMSLNRSALQVQGRTDLYLKMETMKRIVIFILMCVALRFGIIAYCIYQIVETIIAMFFNTYYTKKLLGLGIIRQSKDVAPSYILGAMMFGLVMLLNSFFDNIYIQLFIGGCVGVTFYGGISYLLKFEEWDDVKYMINKSR